MNKKAQLNKNEKKELNESILLTKKKKCSFSKQQNFRINIDYIRNLVGLYYCSSNNIINLLIEHKILTIVSILQDNQNNDNIQEFSIVKILNDNLKHIIGEYHYINILIPILLSNNIISEVNIFEVIVTYNSGFSFNVILEEHATGLLLKQEIERITGNSIIFQCICKKQYNNNYSNARDQEDINAIEINNNNVIEKGDNFCLYICQPEIFWIHQPDKQILELNGLQLTQTADSYYTLATTNKILRNGIHYLELEIVSDNIYGLYVGVCKLNLNPTIEYGHKNDTDTWLMFVSQGTLFGNGYFRVSNNDNISFKKKDKIGILLNLDNGSLTFIKNRKYRFGFCNGSVTGPVKFAAFIVDEDTSIKIIENAEIPNEF